MAPRRTSGIAFVIGTARSGTTALYEFLCSHPDATWISNYSQRVSPAALVHPRGTDAGKHRRRGRLTIRPVEGHRLFDRALRDGREDRLELRSEWHARLLETEIGLHRRRLLRARAPVFVSKNTRNTRGVRALDQCFPDARYVHLVRDPVPTIASLVSTFHDELLTGWRHPTRRVSEAVASGADVVRLAATVWETETRLALDDLDQLDQLDQLDGPVARVMRVSYEDLVADPSAVLTAVSTFAGLDPDRHPGFARRAAEIQPGRGRPEPDDHTLAVINEVCGPTAARAGYRLDSH